MDFRRWPLAFGILGALLAVVFAQGKPSAATGQKKPAPPVAVAESPPTAGLPVEPQPNQSGCEQLRLLEEFLALSPPATPCVRGPLKSTVDSAAGVGYRINVLVALIPDPLDAGMAYRADEALAAIQRGFAGARYLIDSSWLPWTGDGAKSRLYRHTPGALLFRGKDTLELVLLVGETPKGGIHRAAFREALQLAADLRSATGARGPLRILGPSFSGTVPSLRLALRRWMQAAWVQVGPPAQGQVLVVTGSATKPGLEGLFLDEFSGAVRLERTIESDDELTARTFWYLEHRMGWDLRDVAVLSELDTSYGQLFTKSLEKGENGGPEGPFLVQFPSHLAQIRTAREKKKLNEPAAAGPKQPVVDTSREALDLSLAEQEGESTEVIPQFSSVSTAGDDMALANEIQAVCRDGARYVGILATDIEDRLFLAKQVRSLCPDVLLFTFDNHLLQAHPQLTRVMEGSLVLTSFPLYVEPEAREGGWSSRRQSTSELQEGIFRAVQRLLGNSTTTNPPPEINSWVVAVGKGDLWPIASLSEKRAPSHFTIAGTETVAFKWVTTSGVIALLALWLWRTARPVQRLDGSAWMPSGGIPGARFFPLLAMATLALACGVLLIFYSLPLWNPDEFRKGFLSGRVAWGVNLFVLSLVYAGLVVACACLSGPASRPPRRDRWRRPLAWTAGAVLLLFALQEAFLALWVLPQGEEFFYARAANFAGGLSPLVSLACLLAAVYAWALLGIRRCRVALLQGVSWPLAPDAADEPLAAAGRLAIEVDGLLGKWFPGRWFWFGLALVFILPLRRLWGIQPVTEPAAYGWVFLALVGLGFTLGAIAFYRFILVWWKLERVLELLCHTWLLGLFDTNSAFFDWKPLRSFGWRLPRHKMTLLSAEVLGALTRQGVRGASGVPLAQAEALDQGIGAVIQAEVDKNLETEVYARMELQKWFAKSVHTLELARPQLRGDDGKAAGEIDKFLSLRVAGWIRYVFGHLRYSLISAMVCGSFLLVGVSSYAFQPKRFLSFGIWAFLLVMSLLTLRIFVRMDRNAVLSTIGGTDPGKVSFDRTFFSNLFTYGGIPVLGVVLTQFPAVGSLLGDLLQPLLRLLTAS
jgi:hypothetical protein